MKLRSEDAVPREARVPISGLEILGGEAGYFNFPDGKKVRIP
jgi:hypothetical protein